MSDTRPKPRLSDEAAGRVMWTVVIGLVIFAVVAGRVLGLF